MTKISELPRPERAKRYRAQAREARAKAMQCRDDMRTAFLKIAGHWDQLALEAEADAEAE
jgi:hypothetical protein